MSKTNMNLKCVINNNNFRIFVFGFLKNESFQNVLVFSKNLLKLLKLLK